VFGIDFNEFFLIALIALVVLGPERLPGVARTAGAMLRRARSIWIGIQADAAHELEMQSIKKEIADLATDVHMSVALPANEIRVALDDLTTPKVTPPDESRDTPQAHPIEADTRALRGVDKTISCPVSENDHTVDVSQQVSAELAKALRELAFALDGIPLASVGIRDELHAAVLGIRTAAAQIDALRGTVSTSSTAL